LALDAAGIGVAALSGGSTNLGAVKLFATIGVGAASTAYRAATSKSFSGGAGNFTLGLGGTTVLSVAALQEMDSFARPVEAIPFIGNLALGYDTYEDLKGTYEAQSSCVESGKYD
jgi:hypothetical protein